MKKTFYLLLLLPLVLTACSNSKDGNNEVAENITNNTAPENTTSNTTGNNDISGSFGTQFDTTEAGNGEDVYDRELLNLGFKGPEFYTELFQEANNSFVYTGLNFSSINDSIEKFIVNEGQVTNVGRYAPIIASYLESHYSYTDTDKLYPSYAININDSFYTTKESIEYFEKRFEIFKKGNKFNNDVIIEIKKFTTKDKVELEAYLKNIFPVASETSPAVLISDLFFRNDIVTKELSNNFKNEKILSTFLIENETNKAKYFCGLQTPELIPLSNLPESASESYVKLFNSKKDDPEYSFILPDYAHLDSLIRAYIYPGLACFGIPLK
jgi:hypothetical protein